MQRKHHFYHHFFKRQDKIALARYYTYRTLSVKLFVIIIQLLFKLPFHCEVTLYNCKQILLSNVSIMQRDGIKGLCDTKTKAHCATQV